MSRIKLLDELTANGIAAGEVVERPASVVKELVENALDAGASVISVEITDGGIKMIRVTDNGCGMDAEDAVTAFSCHATSKLTNLDDLMSLSTMGFRGEALSSIAAVSKIMLKTRQVGEEYGTKVEVEAGKVVRRERHAGVWGTIIEVRDLFYNLPARYKFLKKDQTEAQYITILCERFALVRPDVSFRLVKNDKEILHTPGNNDPQSALYCVYGSDVVGNCVSIESEHDKIKVRGFAGKPILARSGRGEQTIFVNDRIIRSKIISAAVDEAYKTLLMRGKYAFVVLLIYIPSALVDVNVHPQKAEVRFWNDSEVFRAVYHALQGALMTESFVGEIQPGSDETAPKTTPSTSEIGRTGSDPNINIYSVESSFAPGVFADRPVNSESIQQMILPNDEITANRPEGAIDTSSARDKALTEVKNARTIGILFSTYILLESEDNLILLDQHAAHEKVLYEKLLKEDSLRDHSAVPSQQLLAPSVLALTASDTDFIEENREKFRELGFDFDQIGLREIAIRYAPSFLEEREVNSVFIDVAESLKFETDSSDDKYLLSLATAACKAAVKAHDRLDPTEVRALIDRLTELDHPFSCPHGRPIIVRYSKKSLEKEFKRIV
jgi:DNA mismatch repair protein MutL